MQQKIKTQTAQRLILLVVLAIGLIALFIFLGLNQKNWDYNFPRRVKKIIAICLTGASIALSSLLFQTVTNNRILTPSVMGLDSLYLFIQTVIVFVFGTRRLVMMTAYHDFALTCMLMIGVSVLLYRAVFLKGGKNIFILVLVGMILGSLFNSLSTFMQVLIDPNEFQVVQGKMFASFNNVNISLLWVAAGIFVIAFLYVAKNLSKLDVMSLGRENAINLGIDFDRQVLIYFALVAILVSVSTALVGPITFLGVLVVNLARQIFKTYKHSVLTIGCTLISIVALVGGQLMAERIFKFNTTISVIINFVGGIYFIFLLLKER